MPSTYSPWFHSSALQARYWAHLRDAPASSSLSHDQKPWLQSLEPPTRVDLISAITSTEQVITLPAALLISHTGSPEVVLYHPLSGVQCFADRHQLKQYLHSHITNITPTGLALVFPQSRSCLQALAAAQIVDFQATLLEAPVFEALMLCIAQGLGAALGLMRQSIGRQPTPDTLLGPEPPARGDMAAARLQGYWQTAAGLDPPPAQQLTDALRTTLINAAVQAQWSGRLGPLEQQQLCAWLAAGSTSTPGLRAFIAQVAAAGADSLALDALLIVAAQDRAGVLHTYCATRGLERYESEAELLGTLADRQSAMPWLPCLSQRQRDRLQALQLDSLSLRPLPDPTLAGFVQHVLQAQRLGLHANLETLGKQDWQVACQQALALDQHLDAQLRTMGRLFPADLRDSPASLTYLGTEALRDLHSPRRLLANVSDLADQYGRYQKRAPDLLSVTRAVAQLQLCYLLEDGQTVDTVQWRPADSQQPAVNLLEAIWQAALADSDPPPPQQALAAPAEAPAGVSTSLSGPLLSRVIATSRQQLRAQLADSLAHHHALGSAYRRKFKALLQSLASTSNDPALEPADSAPDPNPEFMLQAYDRLISGALPAACLPEQLRLAIPQDAIEQGLERLQQHARDLWVRQMTPTWLAEAAPNAQLTYLRCLASNLVATSSEDDYLFGITDVVTCAQTRLQQRLDQDYSAGRLHPDAVYITSQRYIVAPAQPGDIPSSLPAATVSHRQSLVSYALNHYQDWDYSITAIELGAGHPAPASLDARYVRSLVRELDVGGYYQALLAEKFNPDHREYPRRLELFCRQLPGQLLEQAWRAHLKEGLAEHAVAMLNQVLHYPDADLRPALNARHIDLQGLALVADTGMSADLIAGCYLFSTRGGGPLVLYIPYQQDATLRFFADDSALLCALIDDQKLQQCLLSHMTPQVRTRYDHGGFKEPHLALASMSNFDFFPTPPGPVSLAHVPVTGNALRHLFEHNARDLQQRARAQLLSAAQVRWNALVNVMSLAWEQISMFLPGKVGLAVAAWQLELSTLQIARNLQQRNWSQTLAQLTFALVQGLLIGRHLEATPERLSSSDQFWRDLRQTPEHDAGLMAYEAMGESVAELQLETSSQTYGRSDDAQRFIHLNGKLYRARMQEGRWYLAAAPTDEPGPRVYLDPHRRWLIDPTQPWAVNEGGVTSRLGGQLMRWSLSRNEIVVMAIGARQIQRMMPQRGRMLHSAHTQALTYLNTALVNLRRATSTQSASSLTRKVLKDFFGVAQVSPQLVQHVRAPLEKIAEVMASRAYSPSDSPRYVMARGMSPASGLGLAFMSVNDPQKQVFLLDEFFDIDVARYLPLQQPFTPEQANAVSQAMILLHEFSHIVCNTRDIRYLEAATPFVEKLRPSLRQAWLRSRHDESFSHRTPAAQLFIARDESTGQVRDIRNEDRKGRALVLRLAAAPDLNDARQRFLNNEQIRSRILLMNADSVALLIYRLGSTLHGG